MRISRLKMAASSETYVHCERRASRSCLKIHNTRPWMTIISVPLQRLFRMFAPSNSSSTEALEPIESSPLRHLLALGQSLGNTFCYYLSEY
jgi:hypothetical protein